MPSFVIPASGDFNFAVGPTTMNLGGFTVNNARFTFRRVNGQVSIPDFGGTLVVPGPNNTTLATATVSGVLPANGSFKVTGTTASGVNLAGLPVGSLSGSASVTLTSTGLTLNGSLGGGVLSQVTAVGGITGTLNVSTKGELSLSGNVSVTVSPLTYGQFRLQPLNGGNFTATLNNNGLTIPTGARFYYQDVRLATFAIPSFTIPAGGDYSFRYGPTSVALGGFTLDNVGFTFERQNGVVAVPNFSGTLLVPKRDLSTLVAVSVSGSLNSKGTFSLTGTTSGNLNLSNPFLPVSTLSTRATVTLTESSLTLEGGVSGGVLDQAPPAATASAKLTVSDDGGASLSGSDFLTCRPKFRREWNRDEPM